MRSISFAELNAFVEFVEVRLVLQFSLHRIYGGTGQTAAEMFDLLEIGKLHPPTDVCVDAGAGV